MLREDIFFNFKINRMDWSNLQPTATTDTHYFVTMQIFHRNGKPLSNKTMIPNVKSDTAEPANEAYSWTFLQINMEALICEDVALCIEVYKVSSALQDTIISANTEDFISKLGLYQDKTVVKTMEGWSTINLSASYAFSN